MATPSTVHNAVQDRLITTGLVLAALPVLICSVAWGQLDAALDLCPWAHMTLEASLNLLWLVLAVGSLAHWLAPERTRRCHHLHGLVTLVFVLSLLFPVISANDDLAQQELINDAKSSQSLVASLRTDKPLPGTVWVLNSAVPPTIHLASYSPALADSVSEPSVAASVTVLGDATGNHSPPLC